MNIFHKKSNSSEEPVIAVEPNSLAAVTTGPNELAGRLTLIQRLKRLISPSQITKFRTLIALAVVMCASILLAVLIQTKVINFKSNPPNTSTSKSKLDLKTTPKTSSLATNSTKTSTPATTPKNSTTKDSGSSGNSTTATPTISSSSGGGSGNSCNSSINHVWILTSNAFKELISDPTAACRLKQDTIYLIGGAPMAGYNIIPTIDFSDETKLQGMISKKPSYVKAVLYDNEDWSCTPASSPCTPSDQQAPIQNLASYYQMAEALAHQNGLQFVSTPGLDLTKVLNNTSSDSTTDYLNDGQSAGIDGISGAVTGSLNANGQYADVIDVQAQSQIQNRSTYFSFIQQATAEAKKSNPNIIVVAGVSTCAGDPSESLLKDAMVNSDSITGLSGWWLNIPNTGNCSANSVTIGNAIWAVDNLPWY